jgi:hypothetical protein
MKTHFLIIIVCLFGYGQLNAQQQPSLRVPSSPAFSILDYEPSSVLKPSSLKDLGTDILSSFDENGKLRMNLGLELTPYWLSSRPSLTSEKYESANPVQVLLQTLSVSAATVRDTSTGRDNFGAGMRFQLLRGKPSSEYLNQRRELVKLKTVQSLVTICRAQASSFPDLDSARSYFLRQLDSIKDLSPQQKQEINDMIDQQFRSGTNIREFFEAVNEDLNELYQPVVEATYELSKQRYGLFFELAGATAFSRVDNENSLSRAGVWINLSNYYAKDDAWHINARYQFSSLDTSMNNFDLGFAYTKKLNRFNVEAEGMLRWYSANIPSLNNLNQPGISTEKSFTYRLAFQTSYMITDAISLNLSLGKNFESPYFNATGFFSILGINYTLFKKERFSFRDVAADPVAN